MLESRTVYVLGLTTVSVRGFAVHWRSSGSPSSSIPIWTQRSTLSSTELGTDGSFCLAWASPTAVTLSLNISLKYSCWMVRPTYGKSERAEPTLVTDPPFGAFRNASPMQG